MVYDLCKVGVMGSHLAMATLSRLGEPSVVLPRRTLGITAHVDPPSRTRRDPRGRLMAMAPRGARAGAGLPVPTPGLTIQSTVLFLPNMGGTVSPPVAFAKCPIVSFAASQLPPLCSITLGSTEPPSLRLCTWFGPSIYSRP